MLPRRNFLIQGATGAAVLAASGTIGAEIASKSEVFVGKGKAGEIIPKVVEKMGGLGRFLKPGGRVMIKPNMSFSTPPEWGTSTSPQAVRAMAELCLKVGAKRVIVCDHPIREAESCKSKTGIADAVKDLKGAVVYMPGESSPWVEKAEPRAKQLTKAEIVKEVYNVDLFISLPTAKSHSAGGVSMGIKGLMGLVKDRATFHRDLDLQIAVAEQLFYMRPHFTILDASRALLDNGPAGPGKVVRLDTFVGGTDPVAVDSFGVTLANWYGRKFDGKQVKHIKHAAELGFGNIESNMIMETPV